MISAAAANAGNRRLSFIVFPVTLEPVTKPAAPVKPQSNIRYRPIRDRLAAGTVPVISNTL